MEGRKDVDRLIREKLASYKPVCNPAHWEELLQRLRKDSDFGLKEGDGLEDAAFVLGTSVFAEQEGLRPEDSWEELEQRLYDQGFWEAKPEMETLLRNRLRHREEPYNPAHWRMMSRRVDEEFSVAYRLLRHKVLEVVAMVLLIVTVLQYMPFVPSGKWSGFVFSSADEKLVGQEEKSGEVEVALSNVLKDKPNAVELGGHEEPQVEEVLVHRLEAKEESLEPLVFSTGSEMTREAEGPSQKLKEKSRLALQDESERDRFALLPKLFMRKKRRVALVGEDRQLATKTFNPFAGRGRVALWTAYDYNVVYSASDPVFETPSYKTRSSGVSAGIQLGMGKKHWEFSFGAVYSSLAYRSFTPRLQYGSFELLIEEEFDGLEFDLLQLPVHFSLYLQPEHPKWDFYASVGVSGTFVLTSSYDRHYRYYASDKPDPQELATVLASSKFKQKEFTEGLFEGGTLKENAYLFGEFGLGVERCLGRRWQFFAEPTYRVHLNNRQLGPNRDYLRNFSLRLGVKATVW